MYLTNAFLASAINGVMRVIVCCCLSPISYPRKLKSFVFCRITLAKFSSSFLLLCLFVFCFGFLFNDVCLLIIISKPKPKTFKNAALFLQLGLPSTLIRHENEALALCLRLGLPSTLIRRENAALFIQLDLPTTLIRH